MRAILAVAPTPTRAASLTRRQVLALLKQLEAACQAADELAEAVAAQFGQHPDAAIIASFPGLGDIAGARLLAEIGDDRTRFADARGLKAYQVSYLGCLGIPRSARVSARPTCMASTWSRCWMGPRRRRVEQSKNC